MFSDSTDGIENILKYLPHRYPFLLVDRVVDYQPDEYLVAIKNVTINEGFFQGHFPQRPIMPGVLILEAMAQATGIFAVKNRGFLAEKNALIYFVGIDNARFRQPVGPGDQLQMRVDYLRTRRGIWMFDGVARVDGSVAASARIMCTERVIED